jgi:probable F420-dependent oxidoreductase
MSRPFRIGFQITGDHQADPVAAAQRAEDLGFDVVTISDHVGPGPSPLPTLATIAQGTNRIRVGTFVLNNDMRNPVQLAWEAATIDRLSGGRFELGLGAGHTPQEYAATGIAFDDAKQRKQRLAESVEIIRQLVDGETVDHAGEHYRIDGARIDPAHQDHLPILVGGNGAELLGYAGAHADIIGVQGLGRTRPDGHRHTVKWDPEWLDIQIDQIRAGAGDRFEQLELNALVQRVEITDDHPAALAAICDEVEGLSPDHAGAIPYLLVGTVDEIVAHLMRCRERWGITYFVVRDLDGFVPIIDAL